MKNIYCSLMISFFAGCCSLFAADQPATLSTKVDTTLCTKEELMTFFPKVVVKAVLVQNKVSETDAQAIADELSKKDQEVVKSVELKASKLDPNPFKDVSNRDQAVKIYRETLYEVFSNALKAHNISDDNQIKMILEDLQATKGRLFVECIKKETPVK